MWERRFCRKEPAAMVRRNSEPSIFPVVILSLVSLAVILGILVVSVVFSMLIKKRA